MPLVELVCAQQMGFAKEQRVLAIEQARAEHLPYQ